MEPSHVPSGCRYEGIVQKLKWNVQIRQSAPPQHACLPSDDTCTPVLVGSLVDLDAAPNARPANEANGNNSPVSGQ